MSNDDELLMALGRTIDHRVEAVDDRISGLQDHLQAQLADIRRSLIMLVLWTMLGSTVVTSVLCLLTLAVLV